MADSPEISIILPFYDAEKTLERAVNSILSQTFTRWELILVNNNSADKGVEIATSYLNDNRICLYHEKKQGVVAAFNRGLQESKGKLIARMDADDEMELQRLQLQYDYLQLHQDTDLVGGRVRFVPGELKGDGIAHFVEWNNSVLSPDAIALNRFVEIPLINPSICFRRTLVEAIGSYEDHEFPEDYEFMLRALDKGHRLAKLPQCVLKWYDSATRLTRTHERYSEDAFYKVKAKYLSRYISKHHPLKSVWIWGAGRKSRQRAEFLDACGVEIAAYIDLKKGQIQGKTIHDYRTIVLDSKRIILCYVANRGAREEIRAFLEDRNMMEGQDYLCVS